MPPIDKSYHVPMALYPQIMARITMPQQQRTDQDSFDSQSPFLKTIPIPSSISDPAQSLVPFEPNQPTTAEE